MKIFATGDWHLGNSFHGNDRLPEHNHFLFWLLDRIAERQPDALLISGDIFDNANPSADSQALYYRFLADATALLPKLHIIITAGNHDSANRLEAPRAMLCRNNIDVRGAVRRKWVSSDDNGHWQFDYDDLIIPLECNADDTPVVIIAVPYLRNDVVRDHSYSSGVCNFLSDITSHARNAHPRAHIVMMAHMFAGGAEVAAVDASEKIIVGGQEEVDFASCSCYPDYLTCGHIHKRQHIRNTDRARYTGSVLPMSFAEKNYRHGIDMISFDDNGHPVIEFLQYTPQHPLIVIPDDEQPHDYKYLKEQITSLLPPLTADAPDENFIYLSLKIDSSLIDNNKIQKLEALIASRNAVLCKIQRITSTPDISAISGETQFCDIQDVVNRNPLDALKESYVVRHGHEMSDRQISLLSDIISDSSSKS